MKLKAGNYQENIHLADFEAAYREKLICDSAITCYYRDFESLDGEWRYCIDQYDTCRRAKWFEEKAADQDGRPYPLDYSFDNWETIRVPSCWNTESEKLFLYEGTIVYTRTFSYNNCGQDRVLLKFSGANYQTAVFINQIYMGMHLGGSTPFCVEVTDVLKAENRILITVNNTRRRTNVPCDNTDWFNYGGIYRDVKLLRLPSSFIKKLNIGLEPDSGFCKISAEMIIDGTAEGTAELCIPELGVKTDIDIKNGRGSIAINAKPELWSPETPKLYDVTATFGSDTLTDRVGFREIRVHGRDIQLNGKSIFLKGICAHEESVINGKSVSMAEIRENIELAKEMNCNFMRLAHYPHSEEAARIADEMGILLWEEIPVYWAIEFGNPNVYCDAENQLIELIARDYNRASVIIWSVGNENEDTNERLSFMKSLSEKARELDPTRLISAACLVDTNELVIDDRLVEYVDIIGINEYYGWYEPDFSKLPRIFLNSEPQKPVIISEFGADAKAGVHGHRDEMFTEEYQLDVYERQIEALAQIPCIRGISPWILFDFRCPRRTHFMQNYYNRKGLLSADKTQKKLAFFAMKDFYLNNAGANGKCYRC